MPCISDHLDQFYPITRVDVRLERKGDSWEVWECHRHETGQMGRCRSTLIGQLVLEEALCVLDAVGWSLLHPEVQQSPPPSL
jgi:hypothetical protein